jgi:hypothetical protein
MAWARNGTPDTLSGTADVMTISDLSAYKFNLFLVHKIPSGISQLNTTFNNNSNTVYASRHSENGATDVTETSKPDIYNLTTNGNYDNFGILYVSSISGEEKLIINNTITANTGASNAPDRLEIVAKFVPSPDADITRIDMSNAGAGDYAAGTNLTAIGTD